MEACQEHLGAVAVQVVEIPDECDIYKTVFLYRNDTEVYRQPADEELVAYFPIDAQADKAKGDKDALVIGGTIGMFWGGVFFATQHINNRRYRDEQEKKKVLDQA